MSNTSFHKVGRSALLAVFFGGALVVACAGGAEGDKCTKNSDCNAAFTCQPVEGRTSDYCCGTYGPEQPNENIPENCRPVDDTGTSPTPTGTSTSATPDAGSTAPVVEDAAASGG